MPWCEDCARFYNPNSLRADGACPRCGRDLGGDAAAGEATAAARAPWHFWLLLVAVVGYLGWRLVQLAVWAVT